MSLTMVTDREDQRFSSFNFLTTFIKIMSLVWLSTPGPYFDVYEIN